MGYKYFVTCNTKLECLFLAYQLLLDILNKQAYTRAMQYYILTVIVTITL